MKTRALIAAAAMAVAGYSAYGQTQGKDVVFYDAAPAVDMIELQPHVSMGLSSLLQNYGSEVPGLSDLILSPGCQIKAGLDVRLNIRNSFGIGTGLDFGINNSSYAMSLVEAGNGSISSIYTRNHFYDLTVPLYISWRFNIGRRMMWNVDLGGYYSHGVGGTMKTTGYTAGQNSLGQPIVTQATHETKYFNGDQPLINGVKRDYYGARVATGLTYRHRYILNVVMQTSVPNRAINHGVLNVQYRNLSLAFQFGYIF